jgi:hypothetical protein
MGCEASFKQSKMIFVAASLRTTILAWGPPMASAVSCHERHNAKASWLSVGLLLEAGVLETTRPPVGLGVTVEFPFLLPVVCVAKSCDCVRYEFSGGIQGTGPHNNSLALALLCTTVTSVLRVLEYAKDVPSFVGSIRGRIASRIQRSVCVICIVLGTDLLVVSRCCASFWFVHLGLVLHRVLLPLGHLVSACCYSTVYSTLSYGRVRLLLSKELCEQKRVLRKSENCIFLEHFAQSREHTDDSSSRVLLWSSQSFCDSIDRD